MNNIVDRNIEQYETYKQYSECETYIGRKEPTSFSLRELYANKLILETKNYTKS